MITVAILYPSACEKLPIVAVPITLKAFSGIMLSFQGEKLFELRVARHDLLEFRKFMIRKVITSAASYRQINQAAKGARRCFNAAECMECEQIEDDARIRFLGPSQKTLIVFFD